MNCYSFKSFLLDMFIISYKTGQYYSFILLCGMQILQAFWQLSVTPFNLFCSTCLLLAIKNVCCLDYRV